MFEAQEINADHKDLIHDVAYDFYGQRMATCSSDQYVKVSTYKLYFLCIKHKVGVYCVFFCIFVPTYFCFVKQLGTYLN